MSEARTVARVDGFGPDFASLLGAAQAGAAWALRVIYDTLAPAVAGYVRAGGVADPDGLTNDVFARAFRRITTFDGDGPALRSWVFTIAHNAIIDERRRRGRRVQEVDTPIDEGQHETVASAEDAFLDAMSEARVREVLDQLPTGQRDVLVLRLIADLSIAEIAAIQGRSIGATKALQRRGLNRLAKILASGVPL